MRVNLDEICERIYAGGDVPKDRFSKEKTEKYYVPIYANAEMNAGLYGYTDEAREFDTAVTVAARGTIGFTAIRTEPFLPVIRLITVVPKLNKITPKFLFYALKNYKPKISGTSIPQLTVPVMKQYSLNILPIGEQEEITNILDIISNLIENRKIELEYLDNLIKARFVEMFGDPVSDSMKWGQKSLKEMLISIRYGTSTPPDFSDEGYAFIRATNIKNGRIIDKDMKYIPHYEADKLEKCKLLGGELLIVRSGVNAGDTCVVTDDYIGQYAGYDMILVLDDTINAVFLNTLMNTTYMEKIVKPLTRRAAQPHLNSEQVQSFPIICVPIMLQDQFAGFVKQVDKSKVAVQKSLDETQMLFDSLMQKYFG